MDAAARSRRDNQLVARSYFVAGITYPLWALIAPGPIDPPGPWFGVSAAILMASFAAARWRLTRAEVADLALFVSVIVTLHFFLLASVNDMASFYAIGSSMAMLATLMNVRTVAGTVAYAVFVATLIVVLYAIDPNPLKLAYWASPAPAFLFAYRRIQTQRALEQRLEGLVARRTQELSTANERLREEIKTRERLTEALSVQQKVEAVARMAGGIAHDFNNLLTTIGVYAELISEALPTGSPLQREVDHIQHAQREAASLTQQLLTLGRHSHVRLAVVDLDQLVSDMKALLRRVLDRHELVLALDPQPQPIRGNLDQLRQVVLNLVFNARDAMPKSGRVTIETRRHRGTELAEWLGESLPHDTYVALVVADTGEGMSEETRSRAFDPFFSTKPPERGSGLGLSLVHAVLNQAGGHVRLRSEPGKGTCCELYWPLASESAEMAHASARGATHAPVARILLVEDEHPIRRALVRVLANTGHTVEEAGDAEEALAILEATDAPFDLLITDVVMPRSSGIDLAELATERWPDLKVVLISGYLNDYSLGDADARFAFLAKPFTPKDLQEKVREVLAGSPGSAGAASTLSADPSAR